MLALGVDVSVSRGLDLVLLDEHGHFVVRPLRAQTADDLALGQADSHRLAKRVPADKERRVVVGPRCQAT